jgi:hypothetical protein
MKVPVDPRTYLSLWQCYVKGVLADTLVILCKDNKVPLSSTLISGRYQRGVGSWEGRAWLRKTGQWKSHIIALGGLLDINGKHWDLEIQVTYEKCEGHHNNQMQKQNIYLIFPSKIICSTMFIDVANRIGQWVIFRRLFFRWKHFSSLYLYLSNRI